VRGPHDELIKAAERAGETAELAAQPLPGGKPLLRLLQMLDSRGLAASAARIVQEAVPEELRASFRARALRYSASPSGPAAEEATKDAGPEEGSALSEIARELLTPPPVPPTGSGPQWSSLGTLHYSQWPDL
jgi:hypothetical protein